MGYSTAEQANGKQSTVLQFINVNGNENMKLSNFIPNEAVTMYATKLMLIEPSDGSTRKLFGTELGDLYPEGIPEGGLSGTFIFVRETDGAPAEGWYLDDEASGYNFDHPMNEFTMPFGFGFMCECTDLGAAFTEAGAVTQDDYELELTGKQIIGNASVLPKMLEDFVPNDMVTMYATKLMLLEPSDGSTKKLFGTALGDLYPEGIPDGGLSGTFIFVRETDGAPAEGWYLDDEASGYNFDHPMNAYVVAPGTGFMCECTDFGATIEIPGSL